MTYFLLYSTQNCEHFDIMAINKPCTMKKHEAKEYSYQKTKAIQ